LHVVGASRASSSGDTAFELEPTEGVIGKVLRTGVSIVIPDITRDEHFINRTGRDMSQCAGVAFIAVPIKAGGEALGVLSVDRRPGSNRPISFDRDVRVLSLVANLLGQTWKLHQSVAAERQQFIQETHRLQKQLKREHDIENVVGRSRRMKDVFADVHQAAPGNATVLLRGESGTGKEAIAHAVHFLSPRAKGPFVKINCAALPESLLESELFGHEKGSFTGATHDRVGRFEQAKGGTLFLDEIGDISAAFQAKLLRVLQEREFERVGGTKTIKADVRLVCATNRNLEEMVARGEFRADLYFRINVVSIILPPLRERKEDIPLLVDFFIDRFNRENNRSVNLTPEAMNVLCNCNWPGNVRELENCIERHATMTRGNTIGEAELRCQRGQCFSSVLIDTVQARACTPDMSGRAPRASGAEPIRPAAGSQERAVSRMAEIAPAAAPAAMGDDFDCEPDDGTDVATRHNYTSERERLIAAMERCGWVQAKAARLLNLTPRQIGYALRKYNIEMKRL
jgi:Nif-specific regulatory protein